mgnify:CR=1 FL=1
MKKLTGYNWTAYNIFFEYLKNQDIQKLESSLFELEEKIRIEEFPGLSEGCGLWFRLFEGDSWAWTIQNILKDLSLPSSHKNKIYLLEILEELTGLYGEIEINFS